MPVVETEGEIFTHEETGAWFCNPDNTEGPEEFIDLLFEKNAENGALRKDKFRGIGHCMFHVIATAEGAERKLAQMIAEAFPEREMLQQFSSEETVLEAARTVLDRIEQEVVPFVADELFKVLDRDKDKGVSKEEALMTMQAVAEDGHPFGMLFQVLDVNGDKALSVDEMSEFFASVANLAGSVATMVINVVSSALRDDLVDGMCGIAFGMLDANGDDKLDQEELAEFKEVAVHEIGAWPERMEDAKQMFSDVSDPEDVQSIMQKVEEGELAPHDVQALVVYTVILKAVKACSEAGDLSPDGLSALCANSSLEFLETMRKMMVPLLPVPEAMLAPILDAGQDALKATTQSSMKPLTDAYFALLDSDGDGTLQNAELMAIPSVFAPGDDSSAEDKFQRIFRILDTDGDGSVDKDESVAFGHKLYDIVVASAKFGVSTYQELAKAVARAFIHMYISKVAEDGATLSEEQFMQLAAAFEEDGPGALLGPMMQ